MSDHQVTVEQLRESLGEHQGKIDAANLYRPCGFESNSRHLWDIVESYRRKTLSPRWVKTILEPPLEPHLYLLGAFLEPPEPLKLFITIMAWKLQMGRSTSTRNRPARPASGWRSH